MRLPVRSMTIWYAARDVSIFADRTGGSMQILRRSCVNWRKRNRRVIVASHVSKDIQSRALLSSALAFFRLANNNPVAFHLCFRRTLFNILPSYSRGAVLQFIRRRWQRQPPAGSSGLIKFTEPPLPRFLSPFPSRHGFRLVKVTTFAFHLGKATIRVTIRFSRSPEVGTPKPRPPLGSRARVVLHYKADLFFPPLHPFARCSMQSPMLSAMPSSFRDAFMRLLARTKRSLWSTDVKSHSSVWFTTRWNALPPKITSAFPVGHWIIKMSSVLFPEK